MRKLSIYLFTAAATLAAAGAIPATAFAATGTYNIPGGKVVVMSGSINGSGGILPDMPGLNLPGCGKPDNSLPLPGFPIPDQPGNMLPNQPDGLIPDQPGNMLPNQPDGLIPDQPGSMLPNQPGDMIPNLPEMDGSQDVFADQVVKLVNEERAKAGLPVLTVDAAAARAAQIRAEEIVTSFSHTRPNGSNFSTALEAADAGYRSWGENIAYGQTTPEQVVAGWMNSSGHRANILNRNFTSIGVGHYKNSAGVDYWTQLFVQL